MNETLRCICGREVGIVRLNADTLAFGHRTNPRNNRHRVQLARAARNAGAPATGQRERLDTEDTSGLSPTPALGRAALQSGNATGSPGRSRSVHGPSRRGAVIEGSPLERVRRSDAAGA